MFSATESSSNITVSWCTAVIPARIAACGLAKRHRCAAELMVPASGW
jgi:hypothetical protein